MNSASLGRAVLGFLAAFGAVGWAFHLGLRWVHVHGASCAVLAAWFVMGLRWARPGGLGLLQGGPTLALCALVAGLRQAPSIRAYTDLDWVGSGPALMCWAVAWVAFGFGCQAWRLAHKSADRPAQSPRLEVGA